jgi:hypothetical protein
MRKALAITLLIIFVLPSMSLAGSWRWGPRHRHRPFYKPYKVIKNYNNNGGAIAAGVLGGILTGVVLDRILAPPPQRQPPPTNPPPYHTPQPGYPRAGDPYDRGFQQGYQQGVERGRAERYEQGQQQGYDRGLNDAASGRIWASTGP